MKEESMQQRMNPVLIMILALVPVFAVGMAQAATITFEAIDLEDVNVGEDLWQ
jgi:hypothetical protein